MLWCSVTDPPLGFGNLRQAAAECAPTFLCLAKEKSPRPVEKKTLSRRCGGSFVNQCPRNLIAFYQVRRTLAPEGIYRRKLTA